MIEHTWENDPPQPPPVTELVTEEGAPLLPKVVLPGTPETCTRCGATGYLIFREHQDGIMSGSYWEHTFTGPCKD